jgi:hypothetical protein
MQDADILQEFLVESAENLARLDHEMVELERCPQDRELLASIFRTIIPCACAATHSASACISPIQPGFSGSL